MLASNQRMPVAGPSTPSGSTSSGSSSGKRKEGPLKKVQRACDACRLQRVKCERREGHDDCLKCHTLEIKCVTSEPKSRKIKQGSRIAQAKNLYALQDAGPTDRTAQHSESSKVARRLDPAGPIESGILRGIDANALVIELVESAARLKVLQLPGLRWLDIKGALSKANGNFNALDPVDQSLFYVLAAMSARVSSSQVILGENAPSFEEIYEISSGSGDPSSLCQYGDRRTDVCNELLEMAIKSVNKNNIFCTSYLRCAATLLTLETLILVYQPEVSFSEEAARKARPYSGAAAMHLRIVDCNVDMETKRTNGFGEVAWVAMCRDTLVALATGRTMHFTSQDLQLMLEFDESSEARMPSVAELMSCWLVNQRREGTFAMQLWGVVIRQTRAFVDKVSQPLAQAKSKLDLVFIDEMYHIFKVCRRRLDEAQEAMVRQHYGAPIPFSMEFLKYYMDFVILQSHKHIIWRCEGLKNPSEVPNYQWYFMALHSLRQRSEDEVFQASRDVAANIERWLQPCQLCIGWEAGFFLPGYFVYESLVPWMVVLMNVKTVEEGGRNDYTRAAKISDLKILRSALAKGGWSKSGMESHVKLLNTVIDSLEKQSLLFLTNFSSLTDSEPPMQPEVPPQPTLPRSGSVLPTVETMSASAFSTTSADPIYGLLNENLFTVQSPNISDNVDLGQTNLDTATFAITPEWVNTFLEMNNL